MHIVKGFIFILFIFLASVSYVHTKEIDNLPFNEDVRWSFHALPENVDNIDWRSLDRWYLITNLFDTVVKFDMNQNLVAGIAERWNVSPDRLRYTFYIKKGLRFSNSREIKAEDVSFSLKRYLLFQNSSNILKKAIVDADKLTHINDSISGISIDSDYILTIRLNFPLENIWSFLSQPHIGGVIAKESISDKTLLMHPPIISSGPYVISSYSQDHYFLEVNKLYKPLQADAPKSIGLYKHSDASEAISWFFDGRTNLYSMLDPFQKEGWDRLIKKKYIAYPFHRIGFLYLNDKNPYLKNKFVREQIFKTMSSKYLSKIHNPLLIWSNSFFQPGSSGFFTEEEISNDGKLNRLHIPKTMTVLLEKDISTSEISALIKERMKEIGINVDFEYLTKHEISKRFSKGDFDMGVISVGFPLQDLSLGVYMYFVEKPSYLHDVTGNITNFFYRYVQTVDPREKSNLLRNISKQIMQDKVVIPLYHTGIRHVISDHIIIDEPEQRVDLQLAKLRMKSL